MNSIRIMIIIGLIVLLICKILVYWIDEKNPVNHVDPREQCHCDDCDCDCEDYDLKTIKLCSSCYRNFWDRKSNRFID